MEQRSHANYVVAAQDAQTMLEQRECAGDMVEDEKLESYSAQNLLKRIVAYSYSQIVVRTETHPITIVDTMDSDSIEEPFCMRMLSFPPHVLVSNPNEFE